MEHCAPVLIPTLNRFQHFISCIESLSKCSLASDTELIIALDFPLKEDQWEGYIKIKDFIRQGIGGFAKVTLFEREENYGIERNVYCSIDEVFQKHQMLIFSEDDNLFSHDFLRFVNKGLAEYRSNERVFSVSGYQYPFQIPADYSESAYFWKGFSAWGVGIWKEKWKKVRFEKDVAHREIRELLRSYSDIREFAGIANHYLTSNLVMYRRGRVSGDGRVCLHLYRTDSYSLFPTVSRVKNMGHDGSGTGCGLMEDDLYAAQPIYTGSSDYTLPKAIESDSNINKMLYRHFKKSSIIMFMAYIATVLVNAGIIRDGTKSV